MIMVAIIVMLILMQYVVTPIVHKFTGFTNIFTFIYNSFSKVFGVEVFRRKVLETRTYYKQYPQPEKRRKKNYCALPIKIFESNTC